MIENKRIIVTGGNGFLGSHIVNILKDQNEVFVPKSRDYDLRRKQDVVRIFDDFPNANMMIHAASDIGGIGYSSSHPADQFYNNTLINLNIIDESYKNGIEKFVGIGSVCEYPAETPVPFKEETLWNGYPVETNDAYGLTKRMMLAQCEAYRRQYGLNYIHLLPVNLYGPRDNFDYQSSHVIPAIIKKVAKAIESGSTEVKLWGTGKESREFVYVKDAASAVVLAAEYYNCPSPVNIGSGKEITIEQLAQIIGDLMGYNGEFTFLDNGLGGQVRRMLDVTKAYDKFGFKAQTSMKDGLKETIAYFYSAIA